MELNVKLYDGIIEKAGANITQGLLLKDRIIQKIV